MTVVSLVLSALAALSLAFALIYGLARRWDNYGVVDVAWSYAFAGLAVFYATASSGWLPRRVLLASLAVLWSVRLGTHLLRRVAAHHPVEDGRYVQLRREWVGNFGPKMFGFFQLQAGSVALLGLPFLLPTLNASEGWSAWEITGALLWSGALLGEATADAQLAAFKRDPANRGLVCARGLWRWSRHPNYFFEWLVWVAFAVFALGSPWGWLGLLAPLIMLHLLLRVTGVPLNEAQAIRTKGDAYREYQRTTSAFVPWFRRPANDARPPV